MSDPRRPIAADRPVRAISEQARPAVNAAGAVATFIVARWQAVKGKTD
jgi:hypothetical protein